MNSPPEDHLYFPKQENIKKYNKQINLPSSVIVSQLFSYFLKSFYLLLFV